MSPSPLHQLQTNNNLARFPVSLGLAILINLLLFLAIQQLVQPEHSILQLPEKVTLVEFIRLKQSPEEADAKRDQLPEKPKPPKEPPPEMILQKPDKPEPKKTKPLLPQIKLPLELTGGPHLGEFKKTVGKPKPVVENIKQEAATKSIEVAVQDPAPTIETDIVPTYRSDPKYPPRARRAGIEGVVTVEFTITTNGTVTDPVIIKSDPPKIFDRSVVKAIKRWRFEAKISNGVPVARRARQDIKFSIR